MRTARDAASSVSRGRSISAWPNGDVGEERPDGHGVFVVAAGTGLDARIMAAAHEDWKRRLRFGAYIGATVRGFLRLAPIEAQYHRRW